PFSPAHLHPELGKTKEKLLLQATKLYDGGQLKEAAKVLGTAIEKYPDDYRFHIAFGRTLHDMALFEPGKQSLKKAVELAPEQFQVHYILAMCLMNEAKYMWHKGGADRQKAKELFGEAVDSANQ